MRTTYQCAHYTPEMVRNRYVRRGRYGYQFCEVGEDSRYDIRQGDVDAEELPPAVKAAADDQAGQYFGYVDWK